jgi:hypothetical protein
MTKVEFRTIADRLWIVAQELLDATENEYTLDDVLVVVKSATKFRIRAYQKDLDCAAPERVW